MNVSSRRRSIGAKARRVGVWVALVPILVATLAACGDSESSSGGDNKSSSSRDDAAYALLPERVKDAGVLKVANAFDYPPHAFLDDDGGYDGIDYDIVEAMAPVLGVKVQWERSIGFATLIPAVQSKKADMAIESIAVLPDRLKSVSFIEYFQIQNSAIVAKGNPSGLDAADLCGHTISAEGGTQQVQLLESLSKTCVSDGKPEIAIKTFPSYAPMILAVKSGRVDGAAVGTSAGGYQVKQSKGAIESAGIIPSDKVIAGMVVGKEDDQLGKAIEKALSTMQADGSMDKVLKKWGVADSSAPARFVKATG
jgi:polar amino acid transport system substrate-binding protein